MINFNQWAKPKHLNYAVFMILGLFGRFPIYPLRTKDQTENDKYIKDRHTVLYCLLTDIWSSEPQTGGASIVRRSLKMLVFFLAIPELLSNRSFQETLVFSSFLNVNYFNFHKFHSIVTLSPILPASVMEPQRYN